MPGAVGAQLSVQAAEDGTTWNDLHRVQTTPDRFVSYAVVLAYVHPGALLVMPSDTDSNISWLRFRSGTSQLPIVQEADRTFKIVLELSAQAAA